MTPTIQRNTVFDIAPDDPQRALHLARSIEDPWFRAQALSCVARYVSDEPVPILREAAKAAVQCSDDYNRSSVRAWEIAAFAERGYKKEARTSLHEAVALAKTVTPFSSRSEALYLLLQAAFSIDIEEGRLVQATLEATCPVDEHWRCKRAVRDAKQLVSGDHKPRPFFWRTDGTPD